MCIEPLFYFFKYKYISIYFKCNNNSQHLSQEHIHINFCLMHSIPLYSWCTIMNLTSLLWIDSCFQSLAIINVTATDSLAHVSLCTCTNLSVGVVHRVGIAGWNDMLIAMYIVIYTLTNSIKAAFHTQVPMRSHNLTSTSFPTHLWLWLFGFLLFRESAASDSLKNKWEADELLQYKTVYCLSCILIKSPALLLKRCWCLFLFKVWAYGRSRNEGASWRALWGKDRGCN